MSLLDNIFKGVRKTAGSAGRDVRKTAKGALDQLGVLFQGSPTRERTTLPATRKPPPQPPAFTYGPGSLEAIRKQLIDQTPYTPSVIRQLDQIGMDYYGSQDKPGSVNYGRYEPMHGMIGLNQENLYANQENPIKTMRHEVIHALDDNANMPPKMGLLGSQGFLDALRMHQPRSLGLFKDTVLNPEVYNQDPHTADVESAAFYGQDPARAMSGNPMIQEGFNEVYYPASKAPLNYSPKYPSPEMLRGVKRRQRRINKKGGKK